MNPQFPWYDSHWLSDFHRALTILEQKYPDKKEDFESRFESLRTAKDFRVKKVDSVLADAELEEIRAQISALRSEQLEKHELLNFGRLVVHSHELFNVLQDRLTQLVSELAGEPLESSYNFLALYNNLGYCGPHMDAPIAKWTLDICIDQSSTWPIYFSQVQPWPLDFFERGYSAADWQKRILEDSENQFEAQVLEPGQGLLFSGSSQWHYRPRIPRHQKNNFCHLLFLHFRPVGSRDLVYAQRWAKVFGIPEFEGLGGGRAKATNPFEFNISRWRE